MDRHRADKSLDFIGVRSAASFARWNSFSNATRMETKMTVSADTDTPMDTSHSHLDLHSLPCTMHATIFLVLRFDGEYRYAIFT